MSGIIFVFLELRLSRVLLHVSIFKYVMVLFSCSFSQTVRRTKGERASRSREECSKFGKKARRDN